jgi:acyl carrier protein
MDSFNSTGYKTTENKMTISSVTPKTRQPGHDLKPKKDSSSFWQTAQVNARQRSQFPEIKPCSRQVKLSLSLNQERLWMLEQLQSNTSVQNLLHLIRLTGPLNLAVLQRSLEAILQRHESLRTSFSYAQGQPLQVIASEVPCQWSWVDCQTLPTDQWESEAMRIGLADAEQPFTLSHAPLWRFTLLRFSDDYHIIIRTIHHIIFDGLSHSIFIRELGVLYNAFSRKQATPLLDLPIQYGDFAQAQRQWMQSSTFQCQLNYWKDKFAEGIVPLQLPTHPPLALRSLYEGSRQPVVLSEALTEALKTLSYQQGVSRFVTLLTVFKVLLHRYRAQERLLVCSPVVGRQRPETRGLIGYFNNIVSLQTDMSGDPSFRELLARVSQTTLEAYANQDVPLQSLAKLPGVAQAPITRALFVLQNTPNPAIKLPQLEIQSQYLERDVADFDLALSLQEDARVLVGTLRYRVALFDTETIQEMAQNFQALLEQLIANPDQRLSALPVFTVAKTSSSIADQATPADRWVAPRTPLEMQLAEIWESALKVQPIGIHSNFFELGGHSLLAIELFAQIERQLHCTLSLASLFQAPTIAQLAQRIQQQEHLPPLRSLVEIQAGNPLTHPPLFLIAPGASTVLQYAELARLLGAEQSVYSLQAPDFENQEISLDSIEAVAAFYLQEMATLDYEGPYLLGGRCALGAAVSLEMALQLQAQAKQVSLLVMLDPSYEAFRQALEPPKPDQKSLRYYLNQLADHWRRRELLPIVLRKLPGLQSWQPQWDNPLKPRSPQSSAQGVGPLGASNQEDVPEGLAHLTDPAQRQRLTELYQRQREGLRRYCPRDVYQGEIVLFLTEYRKTVWSGSLPKLAQTGNSGISKVPVSWTSQYFTHSTRGSVGSG